MVSWEIRVGDVMDRLREMPDESVHCVVTSPPYWGLRDYGEDGQLGLEATPEEYLANMVEVFAEVRRVLRSDSTLWLNLGDSYAGASGGPQGDSGEMNGRSVTGSRITRGPAMGLKPKDLCGIPWRVALALQADGWWLRSDIIWHKPNPMPESVTDRPTKGHEYLFLLTKSARYFYDADAIREGWADERRGNPGSPSPKALSIPGQSKHTIGAVAWESTASGRNARTVWTIATRPYSEAHFATFPPELPRRCIKAGTSEKGCCAECGAPWERVVGRNAGTENEVVLTEVAIGGVPGLAPGTSHERVRRLDGKNYEHVRRPTNEWKPTCDCQAHEDDPGVLIERPEELTDVWAYPPVPCTVLDPFAGSGTTLMVALQLGRSAIGIELNPEYANLARQRIDSDNPMFNRMAEVAEKA